MSTQADILHDLPHQTSVEAYSPVSPLRLFFWSVRRELWENRSLYLAPIIVAGFILLGFFFGRFGMNNVTDSGASQATRNSLALVIPYKLASGLITVVALLVSFFYTLDALYAERRDRSILFWKSLPISDLTAVLAKVSIPLVVVPIITFLVIVTTHLIMALSSSVNLLRMGEPVSPLWSDLSLFHMWLWSLGHIFLVATLWYAPFYAWCLLVSAWATRAPLLWALIPPVALSALETIVFHTSYIGHALMARFAQVNTSMRQGAPDVQPSMLFAIGFDNAELWLGLLTACLFITAAVQLRRYRTAL